MENIGWKRISGEVFRRPFLGLAFSVIIGSSAQITLAVNVLMFYSMQSSIDILHRTQIYSFAYFALIFSGMLSGHVSARFYKLFNGTDFVRCALATALYVPSIFSAYFIIIDLVDAYERALTMPISTMTVLLLLWSVGNLAMIIIGAWAGFNRPKIHVTAKPSRIVGTLSETAKSAPFYTSPFLTVPVGSFLTFSAISTEIYYLLISIWREQFYFMFLYLMLSTLLMAIVAALVSIIQTYTLLRYENPHWWWPSYLIGFGAGIWTFLLSYEYYFLLGEGYGWAAFIIFSGEAALISLCIGMVAGFASF